MHTLAALGNTILGDDLTDPHALAPYHHRGVASFDHRDLRRVEQRLVGQLERLGSTVTLQPTPAGPATVFAAVQF